jgi:hypothetical protein
MANRADEPTPRAGVHCQVALPGLPLSREKAEKVSLPSPAAAGSK